MTRYRTKLKGVPEGYYIFDIKQPATWTGTKFIGPFTTLTSAIAAAKLSGDHYHTKNWNELKDLAAAEMIEFEILTAD